MRPPGPEQPVCGFSDERQARVLMLYQKLQVHQVMSALTSHSSTGVQLLRHLVVHRQHRSRPRLLQAQSGE